MTYQIVRPRRDTQIFRAWLLFSSLRGNSGFKHGSVIVNNIFAYFTCLWVHARFSWSKKDVGSPKSTSLLSTFHIGSRFCFFPVNFMSSTYTDKNNPFSRCTNKHSQLETFSQPCCNKIFSNCLSHNSPASGWPKNSSRGTIGSSKLVLRFCHYVSWSDVSKCLDILIWDFSIEMVHFPFWLECAGPEHLGLSGDDICGHTPRRTHIFLSVARHITHSALGSRVWVARQVHLVCSQKGPSSSHLYLFMLVSFYFSLVVQDRKPVFRRSAGLSGRMADDAPTTGYEPKQTNSKTCTDVSSEYTPINIAARRENFDIEDDLKIRSIRGLGTCSSTSSQPMFSCKCTVFPQLALPVLPPDSRIAY